jgi:hypothetical protein
VSAAVTASAATATATTFAAFTFAASATATFSAAHAFAFTAAPALSFLSHHALLRGSHEFLLGDFSVAVLVYSGEALSVFGLVGRDYAVAVGVELLEYPHGALHSAFAALSFHSVAVAFSASALSALRPFAFRSLSFVVAGRHRACQQNQRRRKYNK